MVWEGDPRTEDVLQRSIDSLQRAHPELPYHVEVLPEGSTLLDKAKMFDLSPFDQTMFIDADTVILERLDFAFQKAAKHGLALCICECPWARRFACNADKGDLVEFNTGVVWFDKRHYDTRNVFDMWKHLATKDSTLFFRAGEEIRRMPENDQASFSLAVDALGYLPFVLPLNFNFRPIWHKSWFGPIKIWHDYRPVSSDVLKWNAQQTTPGAIIDFAQAAR